MKEKEEHFEIASYILGIASIVFGFLQPPIGLGFGITGLFLIKGKEGLSKKAQKLNIIGIIISVLVIILSFAAGFYFASKGLNLST